MIKKPSVKEVLELYDKTNDIYIKSKLGEAFSEDNRFYELDFLDDLNIPVEFKKDATVPPTGRDRVDSLVDHTDISHARVFCNKKNDTAISKESAEMLRKFALGLIHRTNVESDISPLRVSAKHYWLHGASWIKTVWDADNWLDRPDRKEGESDDNYNGRLDEWRDETHSSLPIVIQAINPANIRPDPYHSGRLYVFEVKKKLVYDAKRSNFKWNNPNNKKESEEVEQIEYWDKNFRCVLIDREPVLKGGVVPHDYDCIPYTLIETGLGNVDAEANPVKRYVGIIRYIKKLLISQASIYSMCDILTKMETMIGGYVTGADAATIGKISQAYGKWYPVGNKEVEFHKWDRKLAPEQAYNHLVYVTDLIDIHSAPRSMFGLGEQGVRSGSDRQLVLAEAQSKLNYSKDAFANGWAQVLTKCAKLVKNVIPGDFEIWSRTPADEFDVVIKKSLFKEPFNFYVEFSPLSDEDEYRRHEDQERQYASGIVSKEYIWGKMSDVDPKAMAKQQLKELLINSEVFVQMMMQAFAPMFGKALMDAGLLPMPAMGQPGQPQGAPQGQPPQQGAPGRGTTNVPNRAQPGSQQEMLNKMKAQYGTNPQGQQGQGGGGNTLFGV